jgi:periplasmic protein TonB
MQIKEALVMPAQILPDLQKPAAEPSSSFVLPLEPRVTDRAPAAGSAPPRPAHALFSGSLLELSDTRPPRTTRRVIISVLTHFTFVAVVLLLPLYFTDALDLSQFSQTFLIAPPPPPPPPPAPAKALARTAPPKHVFTQHGKLLAPVAIPEKVAMLKEEPLAPDLAGAGEGVVGGVPGGQLGGVIGGIVTSAHTNVPPPVAAPAANRPLRVGGRVKPPRLLQSVAPVYPTLAKQTHLQGVVQIDAVIDVQGNVVEMHAVSGPVLLIPAALNAVSQWKFEPTYLNDQPIAVQFIVKVTFQLS